MADLTTYEAQHAPSGMSAGAERFLFPSLPPWQPDLSTRLLELDQGTEERQQFQRKIQGIVTALHSNAYKERFGTKLVTLAFATTQGEKRLQKMRAWIHQVLAKWQRLEDEELFFLTSLPQGELDSSALFCTPCRVTVGQSGPVTLLPIIDTEQ